jgi:hypothetical protein
VLIYMPIYQKKVFYERVIGHTLKYPLCNLIVVVVDFFR